MGIDVLIIIMIGVTAVLLILMFTFRTERELYKADHLRMKTKYYKAKDEYDELYGSYCELRKLYYQLEEKHWDVCGEVVSLRRRVTSLRRELNEKTIFTPATNQKELLFAVKKAMMASHPDRGGNKEDFIRINNLYNQLKGGK